MALKLKAKQKRIYEILSGKNQYITLACQRPYSWVEEQSKELTNSIKLLENLNNLLRDLK